MTQQQALEILKTGANVFLTGEPGAGKTHTINEYVAFLRSHGIEPAVTASTGIAATHIGGFTIHSWSGIGILSSLDKYNLDRIASNKYVYTRVERASVLIIDEVSMLSSRTLNMVDAVCREVKRVPMPFGGMQVIFVGDFFQLPPVFESERGDEKVFAYESESWQEANPMVCYLTEQHRQEDGVFLDILSAIRRNEFDETHLPHLEKRKIEDASKVLDTPKLFSHNLNVDRVNEESLGRLSGDGKVFVMGTKGRAVIVEALKKSCLSPERLELKVNAAVMFTKNNPKGGFANGTLGLVEKFDEDTGYPIVKTRNNEMIRVEPMDWVVEDNGRILATITQLPLRLAWAITVHKSQGMSLDAAIMDLGKVFEFGQGYVALSRVRTLSGLHLLGWNARAFQVHPEVLVADQAFRAASEEAKAAFAGMDRGELTKMRENFIRACGGNLQAVEVPVRRERKAKPKGETYLKTFELWTEGKTMQEIADIRKLTPGTILGHIEKLYFDEKINEAQIGKLAAEELGDSLQIIQEAFREFGSDHLSSVFGKLRGKYPYDHLRLARLTYKE